MTADGGLARCQRVEAGAYNTGTDRNGQTYYLHRLNGEQCPRVEAARRPSGPAAARAPVDTLAVVYDALLGQLHLSAAHRDNLRKRGLPDSEIDRRLYRSLPIRGRARLARELAERFGAETLLSAPGFMYKDRNGSKYITIAGAAGMVIPFRDADGKIIALKVRRDDTGDGPRYSYLSSAKFGGPSAENAVHVPLGIRAPVAAVGLTEGELKADAASVLSGAATISIPGVASWQAAIPVLQQLETKSVLIAFDADAAEKPTVSRALSACAEGLAAAGFAVTVERWGAGHKGIDDALTALFADKPLLDALARLSESDAAEFACRRALLKSHGVSLRDLDRAIAPLRQALRAERPPLTAAGECKVSGGRIVHLRPTKDGTIEVPLCNFSARIVSQTMVDNGAEKLIRLAMEGALSDGMPLPSAEVRAEDFARMEWPISSWGTRAVVYAGMGTRDHLRTALQLLSGDVPQRTVFAHLGWRKIGEQWVYLHAGGAIGVSGAIDGIDVSPPDALARYQLPAPPAGEELRRAVRASLALVDFGPPRLAFPLLAAAYRAAMDSCDFALHLMGQAGVFKSEMAALLQQHFGPEMDARHLPSSWSSTGNSLEAIAFAAKDSLLVVDDFAPPGSPGDVARLHREAERLLRAQGNAPGRQRMRADGSLRPAKPPRELILSTGEDVPRGQSLRVRLFVIEVGRGDIDAARLRAAQRHAADGLYAASVAGFVHWLSPQYDTVRGRLAGERAELRDRSASAAQHSRTPGIVADLGLVLRYLLAFAAGSGAVSAVEQAALWARGWAALREAGSAQSDHLAAAEPTGQFLHLLGAALASGRAHLAAADGCSPETPPAWGWRREDSREGPTWRPLGRRVGWTDGDAVLLEPEASYAAAQSMASEQGDSLTVSPQTLRRRLKERGLLASTDSKRETLTIRRVVEGASRNVLHLSNSSICAKPDKPDIDGENIGKMSGFECRVSCRGRPNPTDNPTTNPTTNADENGQNVGFVGLGSGRDTPTAGNNGAAWYAPGESYESARTPFEADGNITPSPPSAASPVPPRRRGPAFEPDLFADPQARQP